MGWSQQCLKEHLHVECRGFESHPRQLIFFRKSDCCVALPCCLFDLACFFLPSFSHLSLKHVHVVLLYLHQVHEPGTGDHRECLQVGRYCM